MRIKISACELLQVSSILYTINVGCFKDGKGNRKHLQTLQFFFPKHVYMASIFQCVCYLVPQRFIRRLGRRYAQDACEYPILRVCGIDFTI